MAQLYYDFIAPELAAKPSASLELSILAGDEQLTYGICDTQHNLLAYRKYVPAQGGGSTEDFWRSVLSQDEHLSNPFWSVSVALESKVFSLIPDKLFDPNASITYLRNLASLPIGTAVSHCQIPDLQIAAVYGAPIGALVFSQHFERKATVIPDLAYILPALQADAHQNEGLQLYVIVRSGYAYTILFEGFELVFANSFNYQTAPELLYYVMLLFDQFKLSQETTRLTLLGAILPNSDAFTLLSQYIRHVNLMQANPRIHVSPSFELEFPHLFWELLSLMAI